jgi:hypothetical protein
LHRRASEKANCLSGQGDAAFLGVRGRQQAKGVELPHKELAWIVSQSGVF